MNQEEQIRGQKIASALMKVLAIIGLVAILALAAWVSVQIAKSAPNLTERLVSGVVSLTKESAEDSTADEVSELDMELIERVVPSGEDFVLAWNSEPEDEGSSYTLTYGCADSATLLVKEGDAYVPAVCDVPLQIAATSSVAVRPISENNRFLDVPIVVRIEDDNSSQEGRVLITVENPEVTDSRGALSLDDDTTTPNADDDTENEDVSAIENDDSESTGDTDVVSTTDIPETTGTPAPATNPTPIVATPADLRVRIDATGVQVPVNGVDTFFAVDEIPTDRVGAVRFTIENVGGTTSGAWSFKTFLPIEGNRNYEYRPEGEQFLQEGLRPGEGVTFTLAFDQIVEDEQGLIRIKLLPTDATDAHGNNEALRIVQLRS